MKKPIYILQAFALGTLWTKEPPFERKDKGKFVLSNGLKQNEFSQQELEYLFESCNERVKIAKVLPDESKKEYPKEKTKTITPGKN